MRERERAEPPLGSDAPAPAIEPLGMRALLFLLPLSAACAVLVYLLRPGALTDDTYAFIDWGRDLRHDYLPLLEHRTFQPLPIAAGSLVSLLGSATPTAAILICLAGAVLLAAAVWRIVELLGFRQPGPLVAAVLVLGLPLLPIISLVAYNNAPFATLMLWALAFDMEGRRRGAWAALILAGLTRPEAWLFLIAYGALDWWRAGRTLDPLRLLKIAALALGPLLLWALLEWALYGSPLYSLKSTSGSGVTNTHTNTANALWHNLRAYVPNAALLAAAVGAVGVAWLAPRRLALLTLGSTVLAVISIGVLAGSKFNVPGRDFSVVISLLCVLAGAGSVLPAMLIARAGAGFAAAALAAGLAGAALVIGFSAPRTIEALRANFRSLEVSHDTGRSLTKEVESALPKLDLAGAPRHSVAMLGAVDNSELAWVLGVPYNVVTDHIEPQTRLIVQPSQSTWELLKHKDLTDRTRGALPPGWQVLVNGDWQVYAPGGVLPVKVR